MKALLAAKRSLARRGSQMCLNVHRQLLFFVFMHQKFHFHPVLSFFRLACNVPGIATVADLRAAMLSIVMNNTRSRDRQTTTKSRYCWLYHVGVSLFFICSVFLDTFSYALFIVLLATFIHI